MERLRVPRGLVADHQRIVPEQLPDRVSGFHGEQVHRQRGPRYGGDRGGVGLRRVLQACRQGGGGEECGGCQEYGGCDERRGDRRRETRRCLPACPRVRPLHLSRLPPLVAQKVTMFPRENRSEAARGSSGGFATGRRRGHGAEHSAGSRLSIAVQAGASSTPDAPITPSSEIDRWTRGVAQLGSAPALGAGGRRFESGRPIGVTPGQIPSAAPLGGGPGVQAPWRISPASRP